MDIASAHRLLAASGPHSPLSDKLMVYGRFVGSWNVEASWFHPEGKTVTGRGEWHFAWILGGRGIQDVLFPSDSPSCEFGISLRCYDPAIDAWHVTWMQPSGGEYAHLIGKEVDGRIVQTGKGVNVSQNLRWSFNDITPEQFLVAG